MVLSCKSVKFDLDVYSPIAILTVYSNPSLPWYDPQAKSSNAVDDSLPGISPKDVVNAESLFYTGNGVIHFSLGLLDNYLILNDVQYGSSTNGKVIVGFDRLFDYKYEGAYHFRYNEESGGYDPVKTVYDCTNKTISYLPLSANESYVGTAYYVENVHV